MKVEVYSDVDAVALEAAKLIAKGAQEAVAARGQFVMGINCGKTPVDHASRPRSRRCAS